MTNYMEPKQYSGYGEIISEPKRTLLFDQKHRIHQTKDIFDSKCSYCQADAKKWEKQRKSWWTDDE